MSNFAFLLDQDDYKMFAVPCVEAEHSFSISPTLCAMATRKALELAVKWVYAVDPSITPPYGKNLQSLLHEPAFEQAIGSARMLKSFQYIVKNGNSTIHSKTRISASNAMFDLQLLFQFIQWIDYTYGKQYKKRSFDIHQVPRIQQALSQNEVRAKEETARKEFASELDEKNKQIDELKQQLEQARKSLSVKKAERPPMPDSELDLSEYATKL